MKIKYKAMNEQKKIALMVVLWRIPAFITSIIAAIASQSLVLWLEFLENASVFLPGVLLLVLSGRLSRNLKFKYNYGTEKVEAITALCCEMFDLAGLFCITIFALRTIIRGTEPAEGDYMIFALVVSIIGLVVDVVILIRERRLVLKTHNKMLHTARVSAEKEFVFDIISIITLIVTIVHEDTARYTPIFSLILVIPFSVIVVGHLKKSLMELSDLTLDEENQLRIVKILSEFFEHYDELGEVRSRMTGDSIYVDIELSFRDDMTYSEIRETVVNMKSRVEEELGKCMVNVIMI